MASAATGSWQQYVKAAEALSFLKVAIILRHNGTIIAANKDADITSMFQFKPTWKTVRRGELIISYWLRNIYGGNKDNKNDFVLPREVLNLCLQYRYAVNEVAELSNDWTLNKDKKIGTIHLFGARYFVVHRDEMEGRWVVGRLGNDCVIALECKTIWMVVGGPVKPFTAGAHASQCKPIQSLFADFHKSIGDPLIEAGI
eukprot:443884_1